MDSTLILTAITTLLLIKNNVEGTFIRPERHTLPDGCLSLDGSDPNGGCRQGCLSDSGISPVCGDCTGNLQLNSTLVDGVYPRGTIDIAQPDWAMDFFTVNRNGNNLIRIGFDFGIYGFIFRGVELKIFNCETLGTAIPNINVYSSLLFPTFIPPLSAPGPIGTYKTVSSDLDCDSLTTIIIPTNSAGMFRSYFIEFSYSDMDSNTALYLAEIRFSDELIVVSSEVVTSTSQILPSSTAAPSPTVSVPRTNELSLLISTPSSTLPITTTTDTEPSVITTSTPIPSVDVTKSIEQSVATTPTLVMTTTSTPMVVDVTKSSINNVVATTPTSVMTTTSTPMVVESPELLPNCGTCSVTISGLSIVVIILSIIFAILIIILLVLALCTMKRISLTTSTTNEGTVLSNISDSTQHGLQESFPLKQNEAYGEVHRRGITGQPAAAGHEPAEYDSISDIIAIIP